jgi:hypothetical protein
MPFHNKFTSAQQRWVELGLTVIQRQFLMLTSVILAIPLFRYPILVYLRIQNTCHSLFSVCLVSSYIPRIPNYYYDLLLTSAPLHQYRACFSSVESPYLPSALRLCHDVCRGQLPKATHIEKCESANNSITIEPSSVDSQAKQPQTEIQLSLSGFGGDDHVSPTQVLDEAAIENEDDDYWDVQSDEEMPDAEDDNDDNTLLASKELSIMRRIHFEHTNELTIRRYDAFLYDGLLTHYKPEYAASPLRNRKTAQVFAHYIHVVSYNVSFSELRHCLLQWVVTSP